MYEDCDSDGMFWMMLRIRLVLSGKENGELLGDVEEVSCKMMMINDHLVTRQRLG